MKKVLCALAAGAMLLLGCTKGLENRVSVLEQKVASLEEIVAALDVEMDGVSNILSNLQDKVYVTGVTELKDAAGNVTGYEISFTEGEPVVISNGQTGPQGDKGVAGLTPTIDMFDGEWYWKYEVAIGFSIQTERRSQQSRNLILRLVLTDISMLQSRMAARSTLAL